MSSSVTLAYRVVHHEHGEAHDLGRLVGAAAHPSTLDPFVSALLREGRDGRLDLLDEVTGLLVARRAVAPFGRYPAPPPRPGRRPMRTLPHR